MVHVFAKKGIFTDKRSYITIVIKTLLVQKEVQENAIEVDF